MPASPSRIEPKVGRCGKSVQEMTKAAEKVEALTNVEGAQAKRPQQVVQRPPSLTAHLGRRAELSHFGERDARAAVTSILASGDRFCASSCSVLPTLTDKKTAVHVARTIQIRRSAATCSP